MSRARLGPELARAAALMQRGRLAEAAALCRAALKKNKRDVDAHQLLGIVESNIGRFDRAVDHFTQGLRIDPRSPMLLTGLGKARNSQGRYADALVAYDKALDAAPGYPVALTGKAETLEHLGRFEDARRLLEPIVATGEETAETALVYATLLQRERRDDDVIRTVNRHLGDRRLSDITRRKLLYLVGKSYDRLGQHDRAFEAFRGGNMLQRGAFSIDAVRAEFDRHRAVFAKEALPALARATHGSEVPIFVVSMPRSGSTLVEQILAAHPRAHGAGEITDMLALVRDLPRVIGGADAYPEILRSMTLPHAERLAGRYLGRLRTHAPDADRIVDKNLQNFRHLGLISLLFPRARVIWVQRDPMAICFSCYMMPLSPIGLPYTTDLHDLGAYYRAYTDLMRFWVATLDLAIMPVAYEDLVTDQERLSRAIIDFAGLDWDDACLRFHESGREVATASYDQVRQPMYRQALRRYEHYAKHLAPLREALGDAIDSVP